MRILRWIAPLAAIGLMAVTLGQASAQDFYGAHENYGAQDNYVNASSAYTNSLLNRIEALEAAVTSEDMEEDKWESVHGEKWSHKVGGRIFWDMVNFPEVDNAIGDDSFENYWEFRRVRIFVSGHGYGMYEYKLQLEFEPEGDDTDDADSAVAFRDLYIGLTDVCFFNHLRFGHQFEFHGLESVTSSKYITFMERYAATAVFTPERGVGIESFNTNCDESIAWQYGAFFPRRGGTLDEVNHETVDDNQGIDLIARVCGSPYYCQDGRHMVHVGAGVWYSQPQNHAVRFRIRPGTHEGGRIIDATGFALSDPDGEVDSFITGNLEAAAVWGPLSLQGEYYYLNYDASNGAAAGNYNVQGAYAYASYFLTGENRVYDRYYGTFGRVKPHTNFWAVPTCDGCCKGSGAWEIAARWQWYDNSDDPAPFAGDATGYTLGVNWYMNPYVRTMFNYEHWDADYNNNTTGSVDWVGCRVQWDF